MGCGASNSAAVLDQTQSVAPVRRPNPAQSNLYPGSDVVPAAPPIPPVPPKKKQQKPSVVPLQNYDDYDDNVGEDLLDQGQVSLPVLEGNFDAAKSGSKRRLRLFMSSTFTDTQTERNYLMKFVYPEIRDMCRQKGIEFSVVDLRWGIRDQSTDNHMTWDICSQEIDRSFNESIDAVCFILFLSHRYGYCPLQRIVAAGEFETILKQIPHDKKDLLDTWYKRDDNSVPPVFVLQPLSIIWDSVGSMKERFSKWWPVEEELCCLIRDAVDNTDLDEKIKEKWFISVTEQEIQKGIFDQLDKAPNQCFVMRRQIAPFVVQGVKHECQPIEVDPDLKLVKTFIDADSEGKVASNSWRLEALHQRIMETLEIPQKSYQVTWAKNGITMEHHSEYVKQLGADFKSAVIDSVEKALINNPPFDAITAEVASHLNFAYDKAKSFSGRESLFAECKEQISSPTANTHPIVVVGESGCGKTSLMAKIAFESGTLIEHDPIIIVRFCGTSEKSASPVSLLQSLCDQLSNISEIPVPKMLNYEQLCDRFASLLSLTAAMGRSVIVIIDSLDQLSDESFGRSDPQWIPAECPQNVMFVVSTLPVTGGALSALKLKKIPSTNYIVVPVLPTDDVTSLLNGWLSIDYRQLQEKQRIALIKTAGNGVTALHLKLLYDTCGHAKSYEAMQNPGSNVSEILSFIFDQLEAKHGAEFVKHVSTLIHISKAGVAEDEVLDMISCVDSVIKGALQYHNPPVRRVPHIILALFRYDVRHFLIERGQFGRLVMAWYHRQFWNIISERYLSESMKASDKQQYYQILCDYYSNQYHKTFGDRQLMAQPIFFDELDGNSLRYNEAKLVDLPFCATRCDDFGIWTTICTGLFLRSCLVCRLGSHFLTELSTAFQNLEKLGPNEGSTDSFKAKVSVLSCWKRFLVSNIHVLDKYPQLLAQQVYGTPPELGTALRSSLLEKEWPDFWRKEDKLFLPFEVLNKKNNAKDPCILTLTGHSKTVKTLIPLKLNSKSEYTHILSSSDDETIRVWDIDLGKECLKTSIGYVVLTVVPFQTVDKSASMALLFGTSRDTIELWHLFKDEDANLSISLYNRFVLTEEKDKTFIKHVMVYSAIHDVIVTSLTHATYSPGYVTTAYSYGWTYRMPGSLVRQKVMEVKDRNKQIIKIDRFYRTSRVIMNLRLTSDEKLLVIALGNIYVRNELDCPTLVIRCLPSLEVTWQLYSYGLPCLNDLQIISYEPSKTLDIQVFSDQLSAQINLDYNSEDNKWQDIDVIFKEYFKQTSNMTECVSVGDNLITSNGMNMLVWKKSVQSRKFNLGRIGILAGHSSDVSTMVNIDNENGNTMFWSGSVDGEIKVWDVRNCPKEVTSEHMTAIQACEVSPDLKTIVTGGDFDGKQLAELKTWNAQTGKLRTASVGGAQGRIDSIRFMADGDVIIFRIANKMFGVTNKSEFYMRLCLSEDINRPNFAISHASYMNESCSCGKIVAGHDTIGISPNGQFAIYGDGYCRHAILSVNAVFDDLNNPSFNDDVDKIGDKEPGLGLGAAWSPDMTKVLLWYSHNSDAIFDSDEDYTKPHETYVSVLKLCSVFQSYTNLEDFEVEPKPLACAKAPMKKSSAIIDGSEVRIGITGAIFVGTDKIISCTHDGSIQLRSMTNLRTVKEVNGHSSFINNIKLTADQQLFVTSSDDNFVKIWIASKLIPIAVFYAGSSVRGLTCFFDPLQHDQLIVGAGDTNGRLHILKIPALHGSTIAPSHKYPTMKMNLPEIRKNRSEQIPACSLVDIMKEFDVTSLDETALDEWESKWRSNCRENMKFTVEDLTDAWTYLSQFFDKHPLNTENKLFLFQFMHEAESIISQARIGSNFEEEDEMPGRMIFCIAMTKPNSSSTELKLAEEVIAAKRGYFDDSLDLILQDRFLQNLIQEFQMPEWDDPDQWLEALQKWLDDVADCVIRDILDHNRKLVLRIIAQWEKNLVVNLKFPLQVLLTLLRRTDYTEKKHQENLFIWASPLSCYYAEEHIANITAIFSHPNFAEISDDKVEAIEKYAEMLFCAICKMEPSKKPSVMTELKKLRKTIVPSCTSVIDNIMQKI